MQLGDVISWQRTFTEQEIRDFARLSGDQGEHHLVHDEQGRLMAHGLLTATLPTKVGGDMNFIARHMTFEFHRPVFAGDTIQCEVKLVEFTSGDSYTTVVADFVCRNQSGKEVMTGQARGVIKNT
ncbi:MAG TPA: MaoC family dehydratase N-terminal domain-containing protein [Pyrinomonadaceae bacterium]|nr:MaoC family dehydratase N-terminal domain-containing protein [Pyrinomonadaceae bacterium]